MKKGDLVLWKTNCTYSFDNELEWRNELVIIHDLWLVDATKYEWCFCDVVRSNGEIVRGVHFIELEPLSET
jgi:hypothetical protein